MGVDSRPGAVYRLGPHLLMAGDSTRAADVRALLGGAVPDLLFTDPPYGIGYRIAPGLHAGRALTPGAVMRRKAGAVAGDATEEQAGELLAAALRAVPDLPPAAFVCCDWRSLEATRRVLTNEGLPPKACIVWRKGGPWQNLDRYRKAHEFLLYHGPYGGETSRDLDVWDVPRARNVAHPTPKPVGLPLRAIRGTFGLAPDPERLVYDPFAGAGATLLAAAEAGCRSAVVEIDPAHCDTIRRRWTAWALKHDRDPGAGALHTEPEEIPA